MLKNSNNSIIEGIDYETFLDIIHTIPSCIFYKDKDLKYKFSTHIWEQLNTDDIIGKTDLEVRKDRDNALMALNIDKNIIRTKKGCSYVVRSEIDGKVSYLELIKEPVIGKNGDVKGIVGLINNITEEVELQKRVRELASIDQLTGLLNRQEGTKAIQLSLDNCRCDKIFCLLDINKFKSINDHYGHQVGDKVLEEFGKAIKISLQGNDVAMRLGGDEFIILLKNIKSEEQLKSFLKKLNGNINKINIPQLEYNPSLSIGVSFVKEGSTFDSLYADADAGMYEAKRDKSKSYVIC